MTPATVAACTLPQRFHLGGRFREAVGESPLHTIGSVANRIVCKMGVTLRRRRSLVAQELADQRKGEALPRRDGCVRVPQVVEAQSVETGSGTHGAEGPTNIRHRCVPRAG